MKRHAFTLIEMVTVIFILALLIAILLPLVNRARRQGMKTRIASDMGAITVALDAYKADFGDYPRMAVDPVTRATNYPNTGFGLLGFSLVGPGTAQGQAPAFDGAATYDAGAVVSQGAVSYICVRQSAGNPITDATYWAQFFGWHDGADGPGFKSTQTFEDLNGSGSLDAGEPTVATGRTWGPYMSPDNIKVNGAALIDPIGNPILYFPANKKAISATVANSYIGTNAFQSMFNLNDNLSVAQHVGEAPAIASDRIKMMLGDYNLNGQIDNGASPNESLPAPGFVLWSAGPDGVFGPTNFIAGSNASENARQVQQSDDITNIP